MVWSGLKDTIIQIINEIPVFEGTILLILTIITVFRKELSSNRDYRKKSTKSNWKSMKNIQKQFIDGLNLIDNTLQSHESNNNSHSNNNNNSNDEDNDNNNGDNIFTSVYDYNETISINNKRKPLEKLNIDLMILVLGYLTNIEICRFSCINSEMYKLLNSDFIWERLWVQRYEGLWRNPIVKCITRRRNIYWSPFENWGPPSQGWKLFVIEFEYGWVDWILAGANSCSLCLIGLNGGIYNITSFVYEHPGSPETLLDYSGRDGTITFNEIGHSLLAISLKDSYLIFQPSYINNIIQSIIYEMKQKRKLEFLQNPIDTLKATNPSVITPFQSGNPKRRTISMDIDEAEKQLIVLNESYFEKKMNYEREWIRQLAESHYREINPYQEEKLFQVKCDDELQTYVVESKKKRNFRNNHNNNNDNDNDNNIDDHTSINSTLTSSQLPCHEDAKRMNQNNGNDNNNNNNQSFVEGITGLFLVRHPKHPGQPREFYDPLSQQWWIWWSCCGCGRAVPRELMK